MIYQADLISNYISVAKQKRNTRQMVSVRAE